MRSTPGLTMTCSGRARLRPSVAPGATNRGAALVPSACVAPNGNPGSRTLAETPSSVAARHGLHRQRPQPAECPLAGLPPSLGSRGGKWRTNRSKRGASAILDSPRSTHRNASARVRAATDREQGCVSSAPAARSCAEHLDGSREGRFGEAPCETAAIFREREPGLPFGAASGVDSPM